MDRNNEMETLIIENGDIIQEELIDEEFYEEEQTLQLEKERKFNKKLAKFWTGIGFSVSSISDNYYCLDQYKTMFFSNVYYKSVRRICHSKCCLSDKVGLTRNIILCGKFPVCIRCYNYHSNNYG